MKTFLISINLGAHVHHVLATCASDALFVAKLLYSDCTHFECGVITVNKSNNEIDFTKN